jgi:hypothetical protein
VTETATAVADQIRSALALRNRRGVDLAAHLGVSPVYVSRRMRGHVEWSASEVVAIASWLGIPISHLLGEVAA